MATPEEQTLDASATGMTNFADKRPDVSKNIQTAGLGKEIFGLFGEIINRQNKGGMGTGVSGSGATNKVPEPSTEATEDVASPSGIGDSTTQSAKLTNVSEG